jgi:signal transduction histidine kinase
MKTEKSIIDRLFALRKELLGGGSIFNFLIFVLVSVFITNMAISLWRNIVFQKDLKAKASVANVRAVGGVLARATEALLAANEISMLRRAVAEAGIEHHLRRCRIVLPDGGVLADADPKSIDVAKLPQSWEKSESSEADYTEKFSGQTVIFNFPLDVPGKGGAHLEIAAGINDQLATIEPQTAQMAIACLALAAMLLVHYHVRFKLKAIGAIQEALMEIKDGKPDTSTLELDPRLGHEAVAWNRLLGQSQGQQMRAAIEQVRESINEKAEVNDELSAACDALPHGLIVVSENMHVGYANGAAASLLQSSVGELIRGQVSEFIEDKKVIDAIHDASEGPTYKRTIVEVEQNGEAASSVLRYIVRPVRREDVGVAVVIIEDITQQRVAETARNTFLAKAAHELRTPLTNIQLYVESALEDSEHNTPNTVKYLNVMNEESQRLSRTVSDILSVAEVEAGSFTLERDDVHLDKLLEQLKADYEPLSKEKKIKLKFELPPKFPMLHADRDKILLALHNLLSNALKYTLENGCITLKATVDKEQISIAVTDTGIGITPEDAEKIFDKFYRAHDERITDIAGSGLGLAIARQVIMLHGGDITVDSELNKGSTFTLVLPITEEVT